MKLLEVPDVAQSTDYNCGAACFDSMYRYFFKESPGEMFFAEQLQTLELNYTPPENILPLAQKYGLSGEYKIGVSFDELKSVFQKKAVVFVTWWFEDAGHYSLVKNIEETHIDLMDPWAVREGLENRMELGAFLHNWSLRGNKMICIFKP